MPLCCVDQYFLRHDSGRRGSFFPPKARKFATTTSPRKFAGLNIGSLPCTQVFVVAQRWCAAPARDAEDARGDQRKHAFISIPTQHFGGRLKLVRCHLAQENGWSNKNNDLSPRNRWAAYCNGLSCLYFARENVFLKVYQPSTSEDGSGPSPLWGSLWNLPRLLLERKGQAELVLQSAMTRGPRNEREGK